MTISAGGVDRSGDVLERNLEMYRDLSLALKERVALIKNDAGEDAGGKEALDAAKATQRALQTVLELEAALVKRSKSWTEAGGELDLAGARAEILARLAAWGGAA